MTEIEMKPLYIRSYEISIWTLQDRFISVLKPSEIDVKGQVQEPKLRMVDDGTRELNFSIPKFYYIDDIKIANPLWHQLEQRPLDANMHKLKVILNKGTEEEHVEEFLVTSVKLEHSGDAATYEIKAEGMAFHELGKIGYKISLSQETYLNDVNEWFDNGARGEMPVNNINYWNDIVFGKNINRIMKQLEAGIDEETLDEIIENLKSDDIKIYKEDFIVEDNIYRIDMTVPSVSLLNINNYYRTNWIYEIQMDWSAYSQAFLRENDVVYEEEFTSSWNISEDQLSLTPRENIGMREKYRLVEIEESNIYNITQTIAETFGVFCRYEYLYNDKYQIVGRKVVYYNNYLIDAQGHIDLTYPYDTSEIIRTIDNTDTITKMYVKAVDDNSNNSNILSIMDVESNRSMEDYLLNFDYLKQLNNLTDEQYAAIEPYETKMRIYNLQLIKLNNLITALTNQLIDLNAEYVTHSNAVILDQDRIEEAEAYLTNLTNGEGSITLDGTLAKGVFAYKRDTESWYAVDIQQQYSGLDPATLRIYGDRTYQNDGYVLLDEIPVSSGMIERDDFGNISRIIQLYLDAPKMIYLTFSYSPKTPYENMVTVWSTRLNKDQRLKEELGGQYDENNNQLTQGRIGRIEWHLYGARADYGRVGAAKVDGEHLTARRVWDSGLIDSDRRNEQGFDEIAFVEYTRVSSNGDIDEDFSDDIEDETAELLYRYDKLLIEKAKVFQKFERLMGPAMREGNWQPEDDYTNYGDRYYDDLYTEYYHKVGYLDSWSLRCQIQPSSSHLFFIEDEKLFEEETPVIYSASVDGKMEQHLIVDLSEVDLDTLSKHLDDLSFIFYDKSVVKQIEDIESKVINILDGEGNVIGTQVQGETQWTRHLKDSIMQRSYRLGSGCELGWVKDYTEDAENPRTKPVLFITGATTLTQEQVDYIMAPSSPYKPYLGRMYTEIITTVENNQTTKTVNTLYATYCTGLKFIGRDGVSIRDRIEDEYDTYQTYPIRRVIPRLYIDSFKLKTESEYLKINLGSNPLTMYEDFSAVPDERISGKDIDTGYYVTVKPEAIYRFGTRSIKWDVQYVLANADIAIYLDALEVMRENAFPKATYEVSLALLNRQFIHTAYDKLNRIININDYELGLDGVHGYISAVTMALAKPWEDTIEVKNYETKFEDLFSTIVASSESMKKNENAISNVLRAFTSDGNISGQALQVGLLRGDLNYSFNQGTLTIDDANGIWATSDDGVVAMRGGGIFTANQKDADGNWIWNTGILPSGINASLITTGQLDTSLIKVYAGDELRFQLNGEGLYAYKSIESDYKRILEYTQSEEDGEIVINSSARGRALSDLQNQLTRESERQEFQQYVLFNKEGLFLKAKPGTIIFRKYRNGIDDPGYETLSAQEDVSRVEISWEGLILRNWENTRVFYADPDTGDLTLKGTIEANSGTIGGWNISRDKLWSSGIELDSGTDADGARIVLSNKELLQNSVYDSDGNKYYIYYLVNNGITDESEEYYLRELSGTDITIDLINTDKIIYKSREGIISVSPKYQYQQIMYIVGNASTPITSGDNTNTVNNPYTIEVGLTDITPITVIYISKDEQNTAFATYNDANIEYNQNTNPATATWYSLVQQDPNYKDYVNEITGIQFYQYNFPIGTTSVTLHPIGTEDYTFSVYAKTGHTIIREGKIGNFDVDNQGFSSGRLADTNLDKSNYFQIENQKVSFGNVFYDITSDSNAGTFTLKRINGEVANFNIAAMAAYKRAVAAAATINLKVTVQGNKVIATAESGGKVKVTKEVTISGTEAVDSGGTGSGSGGSGCGSCGNTCIGGCMKTCTGGCDTSCDNGCKDSCLNTCKNNCGDGCTGSCSTQCARECGGNCWVECGNACINRCGAGCQVTCAIACSGKLTTAVLN